MARCFGVPQLASYFVPYALFEYKCNDRIHKRTPRLLRATSREYSVINELDGGGGKEAHASPPFPGSTNALDTQPCSCLMICYVTFGGPCIPLIASLSSFDCVKALEKQLQCSK